MLLLLKQVGFDSKGNLKLFDLGLCKEEKSAIASKEGRYCMTGHTGSRRYMAPEGRLLLTDLIVTIALF